jgi:diguanylate cyclase (GGDEF)-like protein
VDTVARLGGDEFAVLLDEPIGAEEAVARMQALHAGAFGQYTLSPAGQDPPLTVTVGCSAGLAMFPEDGTDLDTLMRNADAALYRAKRAGKNRCERFSAPGQAGAD